MADIALTLTILSAALTAGLMGLWIKRNLRPDPWHERRQTVADAIQAQQHKPIRGYASYQERLRWTVPTNPRDLEGSN